MNDATYYVYVDWTLGTTPRAFYVGKGQQKRVDDFRFRNTLHEHICKKHGIDRRIEYSTNDEEDAYLKECELIQKYKTYVHGDGWGANFTKGGDGVRGKHPPLQKHHREAISRANQRPKSSETKRKMSVAARRKASDPEWIEKMKAVTKQRWQDPNYVAKRVGMRYKKGSNT